MNHKVTRHGLIVVVHFGELSDDLLVELGGVLEGSIYQDSALPVGSIVLLPSLIHYFCIYVSIMIPKDGKGDDWAIVNHKVTRHGLTVVVHFDEGSKLLGLILIAVGRNTRVGSADDDIAGQ